MLQNEYIWCKLQLKSEAKIPSKVKSQQQKAVKQPRGQIVELYRTFTPGGFFCSYMYDCWLKD